MNSISVVIPVYNAAARLPGLLQALKALDPPPGEILFVDDGSNDETLRLLSELAECWPVVRVLHQPNSGPATARNRGIRAATGDWVAFTDDDCLPRPSWLAAFGQLIERHPQLQAAFGRIEATGRKRFLGHYVENFGEGHQTANALYRHSTLTAVSGFDETFPTPYLEDTDLFLRVQKLGEVFYCPDALVEHPVRAGTMRARVRRMKMHRNDFILFHKHPEVYRQRHKGCGPVKYLVFYLGFKHALKTIWTHRRLLWTEPREFATIVTTLTLERLLLAWMLFRWIYLERLHR